MFRPIGAGRRFFPAGETEDVCPRAGSEGSRRLAWEMHPPLSSKETALHSFCPVGQNSHRSVSFSSPHRTRSAGLRRGPRWSCQRKRAVHGPKEKRFLSQHSPWDMENVGGCGPRHGASGRNLPDFIRVRWTLVGIQRLSRIWPVGTDLRVLIARALASGPADATGAVILRWRGLRGMQPPVGADAHIGPPPQLGRGFAGYQRKGWSSPPVHSTLLCTPWV